MWLPVIFIACLAIVSGSIAEAVPPVEPPFVPRYTPGAESKRQDLELPAEGEQPRPPVADKKPWRRVEYGYDAAWPAPSAPAAILSILNPLLAPGLLLLGVNLGALLYMLLGLLGLAPHKTAARYSSEPRPNAWPSDEILYTHPRRQNQHNEGKETAVYF
ncbi:uncharacterized protein [Drosophila bipectinata]|uniref:uncharacterized protein n=1 Tax=Drosophila bipectinata TaxID=42026 RepID=UPI001C89A57B|nr:uncharacterized protein LOC108128310 [Drosophila bipectinata]